MTLSLYLSGPCGRSSTELGRELIENLLPSFATGAADLDVLLAQDPIAALDRIDRLVQRLDGARRCALLCRAAIVRERELANPDDAAA